MRKINHQKAQRRSMLYMVGLSASVLALSYLGKAERDRVEALELATEEALRVAMIPEGYHPGAVVEFSLAPDVTLGEAITPAALQSWFDESWSAEIADDCMIAWWLVDPQISGEISMEVVYGSGGPEVLRVSQYSDVPPSASACLVNALNAMPWPTCEIGSLVEFSVVPQREVVVPNISPDAGGSEEQ